MVKLCLITTIPTTVKAFFGEQLGYLKDNGFDISVITSSLESSQDFGKALPEGVKIETVGMSRTIKPLEDIAALFKIVGILRKGKFDIVQYATPKGALFGSIGAWLARRPIRLYLMWGIYYVAQSGLRRCAFKFLEKLICRLSTAIAPDSKGNRRFAIEEGLCKESKIEVVGCGSANGVDIERFDPSKVKRDAKQIRKELKIPESAYVFGSITALVRDKGVNEMVSAFVEIARDYVNTYLLIIGQTTEKNPVTDETLEMIKNHDRIINIGWQREPEKYLGAMDAFVLPTYREGFGVVNVEASAMELPVISTDVPGPQESIVDGETGLLVPAQTVAGLVKAMKRLLDEPGLAKRLGTAGRRRVMKCYEQKQLWKDIVEHRLRLLKKTRGSKSFGKEIDCV